MLPLRAEDERGRLRVLDVELERARDGFTPGNALVELTVGARASEGFTFGGSGVRVRPIVDRPNVEARRSADKLAWTGVADDTDLFAAALPAGFKTFHQLRSADAPERFRYAFDLPAEAELRYRARSKIVDVVRGDDSLATVHPPKAWDAEGHPVPVNYTVDGDVLTLAVDHRRGDVLYPILVDPTVTENQLWWKHDAKIKEVVP
jgi:hypothetical protein